MIKKITFTIVLAIAAAFLPLTFSPQGATPVKAQAITLGRSTTVTQALLKQDPKTGWVFTIYNLAKGFVNVIAFALLILVAMSNILHLKLDTYSVKKMLLPILITVVVANLAIPVITIVSSFVDSLQTVSIMRPASVGVDYVTTGGPGYKTMSIWALIKIIAMLIASAFNIVSCIIAAAIVLGGWIITFLLNLLLSFRPYVVLLAAAISPLAIMCNVMPQTQSFFKRWMGIIIPWLFMPIAVNALINVGRMIPADMAITGTGLVATLVGWFLPALLRLGILILAIRFPFTVDKDVAGLLQKAGGYTAKGATTLGAAGADALFKKDKRNKQRLFSENLQKATQAEEGNRANYEAQHRADLITQDSSLALPANADKLNAMASSLAEKQIQANARAAANNATQKYSDSWRSKGFQIGAGLLSAPLGIQVAIKQARDIGTKEREKTSQKTLLNASSQLGLDKAIRNSNMPWNNWIADKLGPAGVRTDLADKKYFEEIVKSDFANLDADQLLAKENMGGILEKIRANAEGSTAAEKDLSIQRVLDSLMDSQESVQTWGFDPLLKGLSNAEVAKLEVGWNRLRQEINRDARSPGGTARQLQRDLDVKQAVRRRMSGASGQIMEGDEDGSDKVEVEAKTDPKIVSYLEKIAKSNEHLKGIDGIRSAISMAESSGLSDRDGKHFDAESMDTLGKITSRLGQMNLTGMNTQRVIASLKGASPLELGDLVPQLKNQIKDATAGALLDSFHSTKVAQAGAMGASEDAQSVHRYAMEIAPKLSEGAVRELSNACNKALQIQLNLNPQLSPGDMEQAASTIEKYMPQAVIKTIDAQGQTKKTVSASAAAKIGKGIEAASIQR